MPKIKSFSINLLLIVISLFLLLLFLEVIVFRFILIAPDLPKVNFVNGVVKYKPHQEGIYRIKNEVRATYKINAEGWNSIHAQYNINKTPGKYRIAIIGDSYVEALEVDFDKSLAEALENELGKEYFEVYRFGISGAPMSQYLHVLKKEVSKYSPDLIVIVIHHNDFNESYEFLSGTYASNFMKLKITDGGVYEEEPTQFIVPWYTSLRDSATWRYLAFRQKIPYNYLKDLLLGNKANYYQANILVNSLESYKIKNETATNYIFRKMKEHCDERKAVLLIVMQAVPEVVYGKSDKDESYKKGALNLNVIAQNAARQNGIDFIDLEPIFENDYKQNQKRFTFINDGHWNEYGHKIVADVIYQYIKEKPLGAGK